MSTKQIGLHSSTIVALQAIAASILANPTTYTQQEFVANFETEQEAGCIAFHHVKLHRTSKQLVNLVKKHEDWECTDEDFQENAFYTAAKKDLKLTSDQAKRLLGHTRYEWPKKYGDAHESAKTPKARARVLYNRIEFFIASNGTDKTARELAAETKAKTAHE